MRTVCFKVPDELLREIDEFAKELLRTRSELIREAIIVYLRDLRRLYSDKIRVPKFVRLNC